MRTQYRWRGSLVWDLAVLYPPAPGWRRTMRSFPRLLSFALRTLRQGN